MLPEKVHYLIGKHTVKFRDFKRERERQGLGTVPNWGTSFGRQQAGVSAGPCLGHKPHQQQHQGVFGVEGQVYDTTSKPSGEKAGF